MKTVLTGNRPMTREKERRDREKKEKARRKREERGKEKKKGKNSSLKILGGESERTR